MDKIKMVDPMDALAPMRAADVSGEKSVQQAVQEEVENRMTKAAEELKQKYARGHGGADASVDRPTGAAYTAAAAQERDRRRALRDQEQAAAYAADQADAQREAEVRAHFFAQSGNSDEEDEGGDEEVDSDDELLDELESSEDPELLAIRNLRMQQLKSEHTAKMENIRKGHGSLTEIVQDEFLPRITSAARAVCHFYHNDFHRCKIMDKHLSILAQTHLETLFLKINADKAPFFCEKLNIRVLPTVVCFFDGKTKPEQHVIGFSGLAQEADTDQDDWPTTRLEAKLGEIGVIDYTKPATEEELRRYGLIDKSGISSAFHRNTRGEEDADY
uniref:Thioredoxin domain-containing protein n=2 Tax=Rhizochromulina marina TaxID=1034831 RepID=A0A7S2RBF7_9STRA|mmetsp:Transcript_13742/g.40117  ORF Transcript_13742/g.40117 Transcript_13742/m.40117 type:complete len:331 (+) Transcript_13742:191-1183(+)